MKQIFLYVLALAFCVSSCGGSGSTVATDAVGLDEILLVADQKLNETVTVVGYVTHTCKHSGKRCFIVGESQKISLRIEAGDEIGSFARELEGSKLAVTGVLKEQQLSREAIDQREVEALKLLDQDGMEETCAAHLNNIAEMREWMADNDKDYYAIYYMDGLKYEVLD